MPCSPHVARGGGMFLWVHLLDTPHGLHPALTTPQGTKAQAHKPPGQHHLSKQGPPGRKLGLGRCSGKARFAGCPYERHNSSTCCHTCCSLLSALGGIAHTQATTLLASLDSCARYTPQRHQKHSRLCLQQETQLPVGPGCRATHTTIEQTAIILLPPPMPLQHVHAVSPRQGCLWQGCTTLVCWH